MGTKLCIQKCGYKIVGTSMGTNVGVQNYGYKIPEFRSCVKAEVPVLGSRP